MHRSVPFTLPTLALRARRESIPLNVQYPGSLEPEVAIVSSPSKTFRRRAQGTQRRRGLEAPRGNRRPADEPRDMRKHKGQIRVNYPQVKSSTQIPQDRTAGILKYYQRAHISTVVSERHREQAAVPGRSCGTRPDSQTRIPARAMMRAVLAPVSTDASIDQPTSEHSSPCKCRRVTRTSNIAPQSSQIIKVLLNCSLFPGFS
jgi:hypothetical protein